MRKLKILIYIFVILLMVLGSLAQANTFIRNHPLEIDLGITANFGQFRSLTESYKIHDGIDYPAPRGTPLFAVADGTATRGDLYVGLANRTKEDMLQCLKRQS